jgi:hypothetical protein
MPRLSCAALLSALLLACPALQAASKSPITWPESASPSFNYRETTITFDGFPVNVGILKLGSHSWRSQLASSWTLSSMRPKRFSALFEHRTRKELMLGFTLLSPKDFLPDTSEETWGRYVKGLEEEYGKAFRVIKEGGNLVDREAGSTIMGAPTRTILYRRSNPSGQIMAEFNAFVFRKDGSLLAFALVGNESDVAAESEDVERTVDQFAEE